MGSLIVVRTVLASDLAIGGTTTIPYPAGYSQATLTGSIGGQVTLSANEAFYQGINVGFSFDASVITIQNNSTIIWPKGEYLRVGLGVTNRKGSNNLVLGSVWGTAAQAVGTTFPDPSQGGGDAARLASAQKMLAAAVAYATRGVAGAPPTMTVSTAYSGSTIPGVFNNDGSPQYPLNSPLLRKTGPVRDAGIGFVGAWTTTSALFDGGDGWGVGLRTNSRYVELNVNRAGNDEIVRVRVDGVWAQAADFVPFSNASDFAHYQVLFDFGTAASRNIEFFFENIGAFYGINLSAGAAISLPDTSPSDASMIIVGDSYVAGRTPGLSNIRNTMAQAFGEVMGIRDVIPAGRGGQGYVTQVDGRTINQRIGINAGLLPAPDMAIAFGSVNDASASAATAQANITDGIQKLRAAYPNSLITFFSGFKSTSNPTDAAHSAAYKAGADAVAATDSGILSIDTSDFGLIASTGTMPNGVANDSADGNHMGPNQTAYYTGLMKSRTIEMLRSYVGKRYTPLSLNAKLLEWWSPSAPELITLSGSQVSSWLGVKNNFNAIQATSGARPIYQPAALGAGLPCISFDGVDDYLQVASGAHNVPSGASAFELWAVIRSDTADASTTRDPIVYGGGTSTTMLRVQRTGPGVLQGATNGVFSSAPTNIVQGTSYVMRIVLTGSTIQTFVNGVGGTALACTPAITAGPIAFGSTPTGGGSFWAGVIGDILFTAPLSAQEASDLGAFLLTRK